MYPVDIDKQTSTLPPHIFFWQRLGPTERKWAMEQAIRSYGGSIPSVIDVLHRAQLILAAVHE